MDRPRQPAMPPSSRGTRRAPGRSSPAVRSAERTARRAARDDRAARRDRIDVTEADGSDPWLEDRPRGIRALLHGFAVVRWIFMILAVGVGVAAVLAIAIAALFALVNSSV